MTVLRKTNLTNYSALAVTGDDAESFLQGQLSNDVGALGAGQAQLASLNSPQGRVIAILRVVRDTEGFHLVMPNWQAVEVLEQLERYRLRARVELTVDEDFLAVGCINLAGGFPHDGGVASLALPGNLTELYGSKPALRQAFSTIEKKSRLEVNEWSVARIRAGIPELRPETSEQFVAQMLNLDILHAISFTKGCYTGQEIIARAQHRGKIKRRTLVGSVAAAVGESRRLLDANGRKQGDLLESATTGNDTSVSAVVNIDACGQPLFVADRRGPPLLLELPAYFADNRGD